MAHFDFPPIFDFADPRVKLMLDRIAAKDVRVNGNHVSQSQTLQFIAEWYAGAYRGSYDFMLKMHAIINRGGTISHNQAAGVINCLIFDAKRRKPSKVEDLPADLPSIALPGMTAKPIACDPESGMPSTLYVRDQVETCGAFRCNAPVVREGFCADHVAKNLPPITVKPVIANGTYTVVLDESGDYRTLKIEDCPGKFGHEPHTQIASYLSGADNERDFTGCAFIFGTRVEMWSRFKNDSISAQALKILVSAPEDRRADYGMAYALESGRCYRCGRKLTVPASIHRGLGPDCATKV